MGCVLCCVNVIPDFRTVKDMGGLTGHPLFAAIAANRPVRPRQKAASAIKLR